MPTKSPPQRAYWKPLRFDRYILGELIGPFFGALLFMCFVSIMFQMLRLADFFIVHGLSGWMVSKMAMLLIFSFMPFALPISFLIATLVSFGRISADSELIAIKASGVSLHRLSVPVWLFAILVLGLTLQLNMNWVPWAERSFKQTLIKASNTKVAKALNEGTFTTGFFDLLIFADKVNPKTNELQKVFIFDERDKTNPMAVVAKTGQLMSVETETDFGSAAILNLKNGNIHSSDPLTESYRKVDFGEYDLYLEIEEGSARGYLKPRMWQKQQLQNQIDAQKPGSLKHKKYRTEMWRRYSVAFGSVIFVLLGIGYGTIRTRSVRSGAAVVTATVIFIYWFALLGAIKLGHLGWPIPFTMQLPNFLLLIPAWMSYRRAVW